MLVGFAATALMMFLASRIEDWTDKDPSCDRIVLVCGILLCIVLVLFYQFKPYPLTYLADGSLLVDPSKMRTDSFEGIGFISSFVICRYFERRSFAFEREVTWKDRFISRAFGRFACHAVLVFYTLIVIPNVMKHISRLPDVLESTK